MCVCCSTSKEPLLSGYEGGIILRGGSPPVTFHQPVSEYHPASHIITSQQHQTENINSLSQQVIHCQTVMYPLYIYVDPLYNICRSIFDSFL